MNWRADERYRRQERKRMWIAILWIASAVGTGYTATLFFGME